MSDSAPDFLQDESDPTLSDEQTGPGRYFAHKPIVTAALVGAIFSAILPIIVTIWKIDLCNYGPGDDISGVICITPFVAMAAAAGAIIGVLGIGISRLLQNHTSIARHELIGILTASLLAAVAGVAVSTIPAFMLAFPDC